jgi:hypothetical protein
VLRPGGTAFISTHGVAPYHPNPEDYWRWTHAGLVRLARNEGAWSSIDVFPNGGTASALVYVAGRLGEGLAAKLRAAPAMFPFVLGANAVAWRVDRFFAQRYVTRPPDLSANYLLVAVRA